MDFCFRYDSNQQATDVCLVDMDLTRWANPNTDLVQLFALSTHPELRQKHQEELLKLYHDNLTKTLAIFQQDPEIYPYK